MKANNILCDEIQKQWLISEFDYKVHVFQNLRLSSNGVVIIKSPLEKIKAFEIIDKYKPIGTRVVYIQDKNIEDYKYEVLV